MLSKMFGIASAGRESSLDDIASSPEAIEGLRELDRLYGCLCKTEDGYVDTASDAGYRACQEFLQFASNVSESFKLEAASRSYRAGFSVNYRMLFPTDARNYRVDLLGASAGQCAVIWVNGAKFEFSLEAVHLATALQEAWVHFCSCLDLRAASADNRESDGLLEIRSALAALDRAWADFECQYITELMEIEDRARDIVVEAVNIEQKLQGIEAEAAKLRTDSIEDGPSRPAFELYGELQKLSYGDASARLRAEFMEARRNLVACIARLNAVANFNRKGRDDINVEVLESAMAILRDCKSDEATSPRSAEERAVAISLASDVLDSFKAMREYLSEVKTLISRVDPHLRNNPGLVARLVDFEETWEIGARYVCDAAVMDEVCGLVAEMRLAARAVPSLGEMLEHCAVELFLCLPRVAWLRYLASAASKKCIKPGESSLAKAAQQKRGRNRGRAKTLPTGGTYGDRCQSGCSGLVRAMLPRRFDSAIFSDGLDALVAKFEKARDCIQQALQEEQSSCSDSGSDPQQVSDLLAARIIMLQRAVAGTGDAAYDVYAQSLGQGPTREAAVNAVEELMHDLEAYSIELQRHCPEDWNQCAAVLVQQLTEGGEKKERRKGFRV
jgi:hypothetical protein